MSSADTHEPDPVTTKDSQIVLPHVMRDLTNRATVGFGRYGTLLKSHNGRDALMDAYQEALDLVMYLKQVLMERDEENNQKGNG